MAAFKVAVSHVLSPQFYSLSTRRVRFTFRTGLTFGKSFDRSFHRYSVTRKLGETLTDRVGALSAAQMAFVVTLGRLLRRAYRGLAMT